MRSVPVKAFRQHNEFCALRDCLSDHLSCFRQILALGLLFILIEGKRYSRYNHLAQSNTQLHCLRRSTSHHITSDYAHSDKDTRIKQTMEKRKLAIHATSILWQIAHLVIILG